jgi:hypothetical protein
MQGEMEIARKRVTSLENMQSQVWKKGGRGEGEQKGRE